MRRPPPFANILALFLLSAAAAIAAAPNSRPLTLAPCAVPGLPEKARCGGLEVYENRASRTGRKIRLNILVLPATGSASASDPFVFLEGGPSAAATEDASGLAREFATLRDRRDILLVDQRGTGGSHPLNCVLFEPVDDLQSYLGEFFPLAAVRRCRPQLEASSDLTQYTTPIAADDLDDVRKALGYEKLNLFAVSYGTRAALEYLRRHGRHVRTATLLGVSPTNQDMPLHFPRDTERALQGVLGECAADPACRAAFPDPGEDVRAVLRRLEKSPVSVEILHPETGAPATVRLSRDVFAETIRYMLYQPVAAGLIPSYVHAAAAGDLAPMAELALFLRRNLVASGSNGLYLSITCAEDLPYVPPEAAAREAAGTMLGDYRYREQSAACGVWPRATLPAGYRRPVGSKVPVLILSGAWDPVTPPEHGAAVARRLSRSLHVVVPHGGHGFEGLAGADCVTRLETEFVESGTTSGLDTRCIARIARPPFPTEPPAGRPVALTEPELVALAGAYTDAQGAQARLTVDAGQLALSLADGPKALLVPVSPTRFRLVGMPLSNFRFELADGKVVRATLEEGGAVQNTFTPKR
jgi:pimeloyl-ACP methyl ester carboxylesterase